MSDPVLVALITGGAAVLSSVPNLILGILRGRKYAREHEANRKVLDTVAEQTNGMNASLNAALTKVTSEAAFAKGQLQEQADNRERDKPQAS